MSTLLKIDVSRWGDISISRTLGAIIETTSSGQSRLSGSRRSWRIAIGITVMGVNGVEI